MTERIYVVLLSSCSRYIPDAWNTTMPINHVYELKRPFSFNFFNVKKDIKGKPNGWAINIDLHSGIHEDFKHVGNLAVRKATEKEKDMYIQKNMPVEVFENTLYLPRKYGTKIKKTELY